MQTAAEQKKNEKKYQPRQNERKKIKKVSGHINLAVKIDKVGAAVLEVRTLLQKKRLKYSQMAKKNNGQTLQKL